MRLQPPNADSIHLLITDHVFQDLTGRELSERLRKAHPYMKVMHMSGHLLETLQESSLTPGAAFLQKPFRPQGLVDAVRKLLSVEQASGFGE